MADTPSTGEMTIASMAVASPPRSKDPAWAHAKMVVGVKNSTICIYCGKRISGGGITRVKYHLSGVKGQVEICDKVPDDVKWQMKLLVDELKTVQNKRKKILSLPTNNNNNINNINNINNNINNNNNSSQEEQEQDEQEEEEEGNYIISPNTRVLSKKQRYTSYIVPLRAVDSVHGSMDRVHHGSADSVRRARLAVARWWYDADVSFDASRSAHYGPMCDAIASAGPGFRAPSYHDLRGPLLRELLYETKEYIWGVREEWRAYGCSITADQWTSPFQELIVNFFVYSPRGITFLKSVNVSRVSKEREEGLLEVFDEVVREVGPENVVQFVTDSDAGCRAAGKALERKYRTFFWSPCAAHCIDLILRDFSDPRYFSNIDETIKKARKITRFIYNNSWVLSLMRREFTNGRDIIRPGITRFATHFISLQCLLKFKREIRKMFTCNKWIESCHSKGHAGKEIISIIFQDKDFWNQCKHIVKVTEPLIRVLRLVEMEDKPSSGYLYEAMERAKDTIKLRLRNKVSLYAGYIRIIDSIWEKQLSGPLHGAGCFLNPGIYFKPGFSKQKEITRGLLLSISGLVSDLDLQDMISAQIEDYKDSSGDFGMPLAIRQREKLSPVAWWEQFGNHTPELQRFAIRVLSQCCSSTGFEKNRGTFESLHSLLSQNKVENKRLTDLVFVRYNLKLRERNNRRIREPLDPISIEYIDLLDEWVCEEPGVLSGEDLSWEVLEAPVVDSTSDDDEETVSDSLEETLDKDPSVKDEP